MAIRNNLSFKLQIFWPALATAENSAVKLAYFASPVSIAAMAAMAAMADSNKNPFQNTTLS